MENEKKKKGFRAKWRENSGGGDRRRKKKRRRKKGRIEIGRAVRERRRKGGEKRKK